MHTHTLTPGDGVKSQAEHMLLLLLLLLLLLACPNPLEGHFTHVGKQREVAYLEVFDCVQAWLSGHHKGVEFSFRVAAVHEQEAGGLCRAWSFLLG
jgi:hypothetical protein